ncbi:MAG: twin-arginine translocase TatA/TatE family subunit [Gemmatimonadota bacterium]|nr:twin-arginine translocase TatA/TatE family subunit [Gemmatimonadota bacterium]
MFGLSPWELLIVFLAILLLFGARRLPEIGSSLGKGIREFKDSIKDVEAEVRGEITGTPESSPTAASEKEPAKPQPSADA